LDRQEYREIPGPVSRESLVSMDKQEFRGIPESKETQAIRATQEPGFRVQQEFRA
jgi:hypothetical protein